jgi:excinuclease ABC subunit B
MPATDRTSRRKPSSTKNWIGCGCRTRSLFERRDVIIVASVSCIYGLGSPEAYYGLLVPLARGQQIDGTNCSASCSRFSTSATTSSCARRVSSARRHVELYPSYDDVGLRVSFFGDEIDDWCRSIP